MSQDSVTSDALTELGLSGSPFTPSDFASSDFISPLRENQVQRAAHLCRYGDQLLVVVGGKGSGKTFFLTKLSQDLADIPHLLVMDAAKYGESGDLFWGNLLEQLMGSAASAHTGIGAQIAALRQFLAKCEEPPVLLVDNADTFDDQALAIVLSLMSAGVGEVPIKTVLVGNSSLVERLDDLNNIDVMIYDLELAIVTVQQWQNFCDIQLRLHGLSGTNPITEESLQHIINDAGINVRKVFERLDDQLRETKVTALPSKGNLGLPPLHVALIAGLVGVLVLLVLVGEHLLGGDDTPPVPTYDKDTEVVVYDPAAEEAELAQLRAASQISEPAKAVIPSGVEAEPAKTSTRGPESIGALNAPVAPEVREQVALKVPQTEEDAKAVVEALEERQAELAAAVPVVAEPEPVDIEPIAQVAEATSRTVSTTDIPVVAPKPEPVSETRLTPSFDLPDGRYVLQIMASSDEGALRDYYAQQSNKSSLRIVNVDRSGKSWFLLLQGNYADVEAARAGIAKLPASQRRDGIWPRSSESVKEILL